MSTRGKALDLEEFKQRLEQGFRPIDTRSLAQVSDGYVPGSLVVPESPKMLKIMQRFVLPEQGVMLVGPSGREEVQLRHLTEQGFQNILGYLEGGFHRWRDAGHPIDVLISLSAEEAALDLAHAKPPPSIVDIRSESAYNRGHIKHAHCMPLEKLLEDWDVLDPAKPYYMYCSDGVLSATVVSWLKLLGRPLIQHIYGGLEALQGQGVELVR